MTRFFGPVGYITEVREGGVSENKPVERELYGEEKRNVRYLRTGETILGVASQQTRIEVMADAYALENADDICYVIKAGVAWEVDSVQPERPRLILVLGDRYHGPTVESEGSEDD